MCEQCVELDSKIERYRLLASRITDQAALDGIKELVVRMQAQKAALHPEQEHSRSRLFHSSRFNFRSEFSGARSGRDGFSTCPQCKHSKVLCSGSNPNPPATTMPISHFGQGGCRCIEAGSEAIAATYVESRPCG
jgi:hypothetical protein